MMPPIGVYREPLELHGAMLQKGGTELQTPTAEAMAALSFKHI